MEPHSTVVKDEAFEHIMTEEEFYNVFASGIMARKEDVMEMVAKRLISSEEKTQNRKMLARGFLAYTIMFVTEHLYKQFQEELEVNDHPHVQPHEGQKLVEIENRVRNFAAVAALNLERLKALGKLKILFKDLFYIGKDKAFGYSIPSDRELKDAYDRDMTPWDSIDIASLVDRAQQTKIQYMPPRRQVFLEEIDAFHAFCQWKSVDGSLEWLIYSFAFPRCPASECRSKHDTPESFAIPIARNSTTFRCRRCLSTCMDPDCQGVLVSRADAGKCDMCCLFKCNQCLIRIPKGLADVGNLRFKEDGWIPFYAKVITQCRWEWDNLAEQFMVLCLECVGHSPRQASLGEWYPSSPRCVADWYGICPACWKMQAPKPKWGTCSLCRIVLCGSCINAWRCGKASTRSSHYHLCGACTLLKLWLEQHHSIANSNFKVELSNKLVPCSSLHCDSRVKFTGEVVGILQNLLDQDMMDHEQDRQQFFDDEAVGY